MSEILFSAPASEVSLDFSKSAAPHPSFAGFFFFPPSPPQPLICCLHPLCHLGTPGPEHHIVSSGVTTCTMVAHQPEPFCELRT